MNCIYGLVEYGEYDGYDFAVIKINAKDKEKLGQYCIGSESIGAMGDISLKLLGWIEGLEIIDEDFDWMHIIDIHKHQDNIRETLRSIDEMNNNESKWNRHYLRHKKDELLRLLDYEFKRC